MNTTDTQRAELAELYVLETYDSIRTALGHDYGCGQRAAELSRRRRALTLRSSVVEPSRDDITAAFERVGRPRLKRVLQEDYRRTTPASSRTARAWKYVGRNCGAVV